MGIEPILIMKREERAFQPSRIVIMSKLLTRLGLRGAPLARFLLSLCRITPQTSIIPRHRRGDATKSRARASNRHRLS